MSKILGAGLALIAAAGLAGCATSGSALNTASPNPPPPPGYHVQCSTSYGVAWQFFHDAYTDCQPVIAPAQTVIRARG